MIAKRIRSQAMHPATAFDGSKAGFQSMSSHKGTRGRKSCKRLGMERLPPAGRMSTYAPIAHPKASMHPFRW